jgi:hypothetical protein
MMTTASCGGPEFLVAAGEDGGASVDAAAPGDATTVPRDGSPAPLEGGTTSDSGVPHVDAGGGDAGGGGGDAAPPAFSCASLTGANVLFCCDFDEGTSPWGWGSFPTYGGGKSALDTTNFVSPPASYAATTPLLLPTDTTAFASLGKSLTSLAPTLDYSFQMNVKKFDLTGTTSIPVARLEIAPVTAHYETFDLVFDAKGLSLLQTTGAPDGGDGPTQSTPVTGQIGSGEWVRVEMILDRSASPSTLVVNVGGVQGLDAETLTTPSDTDIEIDLGLLQVSAPSGANQIDFDNVILRGL